MLKEKILNKIDILRPILEHLKEKEEKIKASTIYTEEHKKKLISEVQVEIKENNLKLVNYIKELARKELKEEDSINTNTDIQTSNILKLLDMTKDTITSDKLQKLLNENITDSLVVEAIYSISESRNISIDRPIDKREVTQNKINKLVNHIENEGFDTLETALALNYLD